MLVSAPPGSALHGAGSFGVAQELLGRALYLRGEATFSSGYQNV
jgi:hypothetical protein